VFVFHLVGMSSNIIVFHLFCFYSTAVTDAATVSKVDCKKVYNIQNDNCVLDLTILLPFRFEMVDQVATD
jgi:hypothetical protein